MKITKICDNNNLNQCFRNEFVDTTDSVIKLSELKTYNTNIGNFKITSSGEMYLYNVYFYFLCLNQASYYSLC